MRNAYVDDSPLSAARHSGICAAIGCEKITAQQARCHLPCRVVVLGHGERSSIWKWAAAAAVDDDDSRWAGVVARNVRAQAFFYGVETTGIFCRPGCASRLPRREHTRFFGSASDAQSAGFRACLRCRPDGEAPSAERARLVDRLCRFIEEAEAVPTLGELAAEAGMSPYHLHRLFRASVGVTPKAYAAAHRRKRLQRSLASATSVTRAAYDAGYASSSRFYANAASELGMAPTAYREGGANGAIRFAVGACSLGAILVAVTERGVCAIDLGDDADALVAQLARRFPHAAIATGDPLLEQHLAGAVALADGEPAQHPALALDIAGTAFAQRVWATLRNIRSPSQFHAIAQCGKTAPLPHYRWGAQRKLNILRRERGN